MFTFTKTAPTDLTQARPTSDSLEWRHAYGRKYYAVINQF